MNNKVHLGKSYCHKNNIFTHYTYDIDLKIESVACKWKTPTAEKNDSKRPNVALRDKWSYTQKEFLSIANF